MPRIFIVMRLKSIVFITLITVLSGCKLRYDYGDRYRYEDEYLHKGESYQLCDYHPTSIRFNNILRIYDLVIDVDSISSGEYYYAWYRLHDLIKGKNEDDEWDETKLLRLKSDKRFKIIYRDEVITEFGDLPVTDSLRGDMIINYGTLIQNNDSATVNINK